MTIIYQKHFKIKHVLFKNINIVEPNILFYRLNIIYYIHFLSNNSNFLLLFSHS